MRLAKLLQKLVWKLHLVGPDISPRYFSLIGRPPNHFRETFEGVEETYFVEIEDIAHGLAKNAGRPTAQDPEFHDVASDTAKGVRLLMYGSHSFGVVKNKATHEGS
jgi:hypothetical protein